jgi:hypothetical protein
MSDPLRGYDHSERIKPLMQQVALLDAQRMDTIRAQNRALTEAYDVLTSPEHTDRAARNRAVAIIEALRDSQA